MANHTWEIDNKIIVNKPNTTIHWEDDQFFSFDLFGKRYHGEIMSSDTETGKLTLKINHRIFEVKRNRPIDEIIQQLGLDKIAEKKLTVLKSPMPGKVLAIQVEVGQTVEKGNSLLTLEAMKMENIIKAEGVGIVKKICTSIDKTVEKDTILIEFE
jgi:biotin carboxyl carrier protein